MKTLVISIEFLRGDYSDKLFPTLRKTMTEYTNHFTHLTFTREVFERFGVKLKKIPNSCFVSDSALFFGFELPQFEHKEIVGGFMMQDRGGSVDPTDIDFYKNTEDTLWLVEKKLQSYDFVWVHLYKVMHNPDISQYASRALYITEKVEEFVKKHLDCRIIVTADHGIVMSEADGVDPAKGQRQLCWNSMRIPLFISGKKGTVTNYTNHDMLADYLNGGGFGNWEEHKCYNAGKSFIMTRDGVITPKTIEATDK